jgi:hypothetical protein
VWDGRGSGGCETKRIDLANVRLSPALNQV